MHARLYPDSACRGHQRRSGRPRQWSRKGARAQYLWKIKGAPRIGIMQFVPVKSSRTRERRSPTWSPARACEWFLDIIKNIKAGKLIRITWALTGTSSYVSSIECWMWKRNSDGDQRRNLKRRWMNGSRKTSFFSPSSKRPWGHWQISKISSGCLTLEIRLKPYRARNYFVKLMVF